MKEAVRRRLSGLIDTVVRYPLTAGFLLAAAVLIAIAVAGDDRLSRYILSCAVGSALAAASQSAFERFYAGVRWRASLYAASLIVTALFFVLIHRVSENSAELPIRTAVACFALWIAFIWLAVVRSRYSFAENFMASFKALFQALFFSGIIFLGCALIIAAIDSLITPVDEDAYAHVANIVFVLIAPMLFLSLIPVYPGRRIVFDGAEGETNSALIEKRTGCPKFLEVLLSYIIIPLVAVFTVVLLIYIAINIGGSFWTDNLLEPMLISYSVTVIAVTLLAGGLQNRFAVLFRMIFPKVLIPIALFQTVASIRLLAETGLTHTRYFVVIFGLFAVLSGLVLSTVPMRRSGTIAAVLLILSALSLVPPTDAFTLSRFSQIRTMEHVLRENNMLSGGQVAPNGTIPDANKEKIAAAIRYLTDMDELRRVRWLPPGFSGYDDTQFYGVFGFHLYQPAQPEYHYINVYYTVSGLIPVAGYDAFAELSFPYPDKSGGEAQGTADIGGGAYTLAPDGAPGSYGVAVTDASGRTLIRFDISEIFARYAAFPASKSVLTAAEATFTAENDEAALKIIVRNAGFNAAPGSTDENAQLLVFIKIK
jgi:hypothetical protein